MSDSVRRMNYFAVSVDDQPGEGARLLDALAAETVNLVAFTGFPRGDGKAQLDFVPEDTAAFEAAAERASVDAGQPKTVFIVQGDDRSGAIATLLKPLAEASISVTAVDAAAAGNGRYSAIVWVKPEDVDRAATALNAT